MYSQLSGRQRARHEVSSWLSGLASRRRRRTFHRFCGDEAVALAGYSGDISRPAPVVLQFRAQVAHMAIDDIAFGRVVDTPQVIQNLVPGQQTTGVGGQEVEQALLQ